MDEFVLRLQASLNSLDYLLSRANLFVGQGRVEKIYALTAKTRALLVELIATRLSQVIDAQNPEHQDTLFALENAQRALEQVFQSVELQQEQQQTQQQQQGQQQQQQSQQQQSQQQQQQSQQQRPQQQQQTRGDYEVAIALARVSNALNATNSFLTTVKPARRTALAEVTELTAGSAKAPVRIAPVAVSSAPPPVVESQIRYANLCLTSPDQKVVAKTAILAAQKQYNLRLDIGPWSRESVVENAAKNPFPDQLLPAKDEGNWLEVIAASGAFAIERKRYSLFLPRTGQSWVCGCNPGNAHKCADSERQPYLYIPVQTPSLSPNEPSLAASLRIAIYCDKNLIQSQRLTAQIDKIESETGAGYSSQIDYTLTPDLSDVAFLPARTLNVISSKAVDGSHRIIVNGDLDEVIAFSLNEGQMGGAVDAARQTLRDVHLEEYGGSLGSTPQFRNRYDINNAKSKAELIADLKQLATVGWHFWTTLMSTDPEGRRKLRELLREPSTIQVSRPGASTVIFPWSLIYDIPLDEGEHVPCCLLTEWDGKASFTRYSACPYEKDHPRKNVICPFGFWGFRHVIEQPPSMPKSRNLPLQIRIGHPKPVIVVGVSLDLDSSLANKHLKAIEEQLTNLAAIRRDSREDIATALREAKLEIVYFYCHGRRALLRATQVPYLEVGKGEVISPDDILAWDESDWAEISNHWRETSPLIFINGCHTAELTPDLLVNFVDTFVGVYASGVVGTEVMLHQQVAGEAAEEFLAQLQNNQSVGQALREMRLHFLSKGNLMGLAYTPYCSANLTLTRS